MNDDTPEPVKITSGYELHFSRGMFGVIGRLYDAFGRHHRTFVRPSAQEMIEAAEQYVETGH